MLALCHGIQFGCGHTGEGGLSHFAVGLGHYSPGIPSSALVPAPSLG